MNNNDLYHKLETLAFERTIPFCYSCYKECAAGTCLDCGSDDLMRLLPGHGAEYGIDWVIKEILLDELTPVNVEQAFEDSIGMCYPEETKIAWLTLDTISILKAMDPISWSCAQSEWESHEEAEGSIRSFDGGSTYYWTRDIENL